MGGEATPVEAGRRFCSCPVRWSSTKRVVKIQPPYLRGEMSLSELIAFIQRQREASCRLSFAGRANHQYGTATEIPKRQQHRPQPPSQRRHRAINRDSSRSNSSLRNECGGKGALDSDRERRIKAFLDEGGGVQEALPKRCSYFILGDGCFLQTKTLPERKFTNSSFAVPMLIRNISFKRSQTIGDTLGSKSFEGGTSRILVRIELARPSLLLS